MDASVSCFVSPSSAMLKARSDMLLCADGGFREHQCAAFQAAEQTSRTCTVLIRSSFDHNHLSSLLSSWYTRARQRPRARKPMSYSP